MQNHYLLWIGAVVFGAFIIYRKLFVDIRKNHARAIKAKTKLAKTLAKQARKDEALRACLWGIEIRKLADVDNGEDDKDIYCLVIVWKRYRDFFFDAPELFQGFRVFEATIGRDHEPEPCPLPTPICAGCGCDNKPPHPRLPDNPPADFFDDITHEDPTSGEAGSIN